MPFKFTKNILLFAVNMKLMLTMFKTYVMLPVVLDDCRYDVFVQFKDGQLDCDCPQRCS